MTKWNKKWPLFAGILVLTIAIGAGSVFAYYKFKNNDKAIVAKALTELSLNYASFFTDIIDDKEAEELLNSVLWGNSETDYSINISGIENVPVTLGIDGKLKRDYSDRRLSCSNSLSVMNMELTDVDLYIHKNDLYLSVPDFMDSVFRADMSSFATDFNNSYLAENTELTVPDYLNMKLWNDEPSAKLELNYDLADRLKKLKGYNELITEIVVSHEKESVYLTLDDAKEVECITYHVLLPMEQAQTVIENELTKAGTKADEEFVHSIRLQKDIELRIDIDKSGKVRRICTEKELDLKTVEIEFDILFVDEENPTNSIVINGNLESEYYPSALELKNDGVLDTKFEILAHHGILGNYDLELTLQGDIDFGAAFSGKFEYSEEDRIFEETISSLHVDYFGKRLFDVTGKLEFSENDDISIRLPDEKIIDIFDMNFADMLKIYLELQDDLQYISDILDKVGFLL